MISPETHPWIPFTPGVVERPRLISQLDSISRYKLVLICAPPGYGKTTLVSQFVRTAGIATAWHSLDQRDRDVPNLYRNTVQALEAIAPGIQDRIPRDDNHSAVEFASFITDSLRETLTSRAILVLDDIHHLEGAPSAELWLRTLINQFPRPGHLILISRTIPDLPFAEMIVRNEVLPLGQQELRLTDDEIQILAERHPNMITRERMQYLAERLDGWPAGIALAFQPLSSDMSEAILREGSPPEALFEALAASMLETQPPDLRDFLLASSTLKRLTPELCASALALPGSETWLDEIQSRNLFVSRVGGNLTYHPLFREFLQHKLEADQGSRYRELHARAARWYQEQDDNELAFEHYLSAGDIQQAASIGERAAVTLFGQGRIETLLTWSRQLRRVSAQAPRLYVESAMVQTDRYEYESAEEELVYAELGYLVMNDTQGIGQVQLQRAMIHFQRADHQAARGLAYPLTASPFPVLRGRALRIMGLIHLRLGETDASIEYFTKALPLYREEGLKSGLSHLLQDLQFAYARVGRMEDAAACLQELITLRRKLGGADALALALNNLGYYYHQRSDYTSARSTFEEGLSALGGSANRRSEGHLLWSLGDLNRDLGLLEEAGTLYDRALFILPARAEPNLHTLILVSNAVLRFRQHRIRESALLAGEAAKIAAAHSLAFEQVMASAGLAVAEGHLGKVEESLNTLEQALADLDRQGAQFEWIAVAASYARLWLRIGAEDQARATCEAALERARRIDTAQPLAVEAVESPALARILQELPNNQIIQRDLKKIQELRAEGDGSVRVQLPWEDTPYSLRIFTLGQEIIMRDGEAIPSSEWKSAGARELFLYLLFAGPSSRDDIDILFWPESMPDSIRAKFHTTLYRARQALGKESIIHQGQQYRVNEEIEIWCDALEMEKWISRARMLPPHEPHAADLWERAATIYKGTFLPGFNAEWVDERRDSLEALYLEALCGTGASALARHEYSDALEWYLKALSEDQFREDNHRAVMRCYAGLGYRKQLLEHYESLCEFLMKELGVDPEGETQELFRTLIG